jgi:DNA mismatch endonuclease (patch repair protein)
MFTKEQRSGIMRRIKSADTGPERKVKRLLYKMGYRLLLQNRDLPGCPDFAMPRHKTVVFVNGCFWHGHTCKDGRRPKSNKKYWNWKLDRNLARDKRNAAILKRAGWKRIVVWECETREECNLALRLRKKLRAR